MTSLARLEPPALVRAADDVCRCRHCLQAARQFPHDPPQLRLPLRERVQPGQIINLAARRARRSNGGAAMHDRASPGSSEVEPGRPTTRPGETFNA